MRLKYSWRSAVCALAAAGLCLQPALPANRRAVVVANGAIRGLPAGDTVMANAATTANASVNWPHGVAPTSPVNGDCWTTTAGVFCRVDGVTVDLTAGGGAGTVTSVGVSGGTTGLSTSGGPVTASGTIVLAGTLDLDNGGTGATDAAGARTALGLGTLATQSGTFSGTSSGTNTGDQASIVGITGSLAEFNAALTGADFATGGGTASGANTGDQDLSGYATTAAVAAGYQPLDADLTELAGVSNTAAGRALLDDADAAAQRTTLGLGTLATQSGTFSGTSSGTNTGDQASIVGITGTLAEFNTALTGADFATGGGTATGANTGDQASIVGITGTLAEFNTALTGADFATGGGTATGTNTGDQTSIVGITGSLAEFNTALTGADFATGGGTATGTNTGDQTTVSGNAGTATALATGRTISITGKATAAGGTFDGTAALAINVTALTVDGAIVPSSVASTGAITSSGGSLGYATGAGGTVTQATNKATAVTLNTRTGKITMNGAALAAAAIVTFVFNNSVLTAEDLIVVTHHATGTFGAYLGNCRVTGAGAASCAVRNNSAGSLSEAIVWKFAVIAAVAS